MNRFLHSSDVSTQFPLSQAFLHDDCSLLVPWYVWALAPELDNILARVLHEQEQDCWPSKRTLHAGKRINILYG
jgi:hypothetical protein